MTLLPVRSLAGVRTMLHVPMLKDEELIGAFSIYRQEVRRLPTSKSTWSRTSPPKPSSPSRTRGCSTNCASAPRPHERWSSRRQHPRCYKVIRRSRSIFSPSSQTCWRKRIRLCDAELRQHLSAWDGELLRLLATQNDARSSCRYRERTSLRFRPRVSPLALVKPRARSHRRLAADADVLERDPALSRRSNWQAFGRALAVPMLKERRADRRLSSFIRQEVSPFSEKQIELVENFRRSSGHRHRERATAEGTARKN